MFVKQKCNSSSTVQQTRILSSNAFSRKEKRGLSSSPGFKSTKYIYRKYPFQNGKSRHAKISHKPGRLHDKHRLDRRLSVCPNSSGVSKIPSIYLAKQSLPIQSNALWTKCSSQGIHEAIKTGRSLASRPGNPSNNILRRHSDDGFLCGISKATQTNNYSPSGIIRVPDKLRQVNVNPNSKDSIPRVVDRFDTNVVHSAQNKNHVNSQSMSTACQQTTTNYSRSLTGTRPTRILPTGSVVSTVTLSSATRTSNKFTETVVRLRPTNTSDTSSQVGLIMVDKQSTVVERQSNTTSNCRYYDNIRCFQNWLGCFHGNPDDNQYSRTQSGIFCSQVVHERQNKQSDLLEIGQHYGGSVLEQHGGHTLSSASSTDSRDLGMVRKQKRISSRPTYSRCKQYGSRCRVPNYEGLERLEAEVRCDPPINNRMPSRPICITPVPPARQICQLETGPQRVIHGAFAISWSNMTAYSMPIQYILILYAFPPFNLTHAVLHKVRAENATLVLVAPLWSVQPWWFLLIVMLIDYPVYLGNNKELLTDVSNPGPFHPLFPTLKPCGKYQGTVRVSWPFKHSCRTPFKQR